MSAQKPQVLYFTGAHCAVCRRMAPRVQATAEDFRDRVDLVEIDVAVDADQVAEHSVRAVPTLVAVHDGTVVGRAVGGQSREALNEIFAGAAAGRLRTLPLSTTDRAMRLGAAAAVGVIAYLAAQPLLLVAVAGLGLYAFWGHMPFRNR